jgi:hypothetical protein
MPKALLTADKQTGSKQSIPRKSCGNNLFHSVGELPLQNTELKERLLDRALRGDKYSSANEESMRNRAQHTHPNGEYFGNSHSFLPHLENSKQSRGSKHSKGSKGSKTSSQSKSASMVEEKIRQYRALESKHSKEFEKVLGASPKEVKRLQKMHSLERLRVIEELERVTRFA